MQDQFVSAYLATIRRRVFSPEGGFAGLEGGGYRADATAWGAVALEAVGQSPDWLTTARARLEAQQLADGRVSLSPQHPDAVWLTPLAVLAWHQARDYRDATDKATRFMLATTGRHWPRNPDLPYEHDPSIKGWPWISATHSWVEPTALAVLALRISGRGEHQRVEEGVRLLLDRQLPGGGWNYGNTRIFGRELFPFPESTGVALNALRGAAEPARVRKSLDYLHSSLREVRTPVALSWGLMGLAAWGEAPPEGGLWIKECLAKQERYGPYDTVSLSLLLVASRAPQGLESVFANRGKS
jgi:hypothetical protein